VADQLDQLLRRAVSQRAAIAPTPRPFEQLDLEHPTMRPPTKNQRILLVAAVGLAAVAGIGLWALRADDATTIATDPTTTTTEATAQDEESATTTSTARSVADVATEFWEALAAGDRQATLDLIATASMDSIVLPPAGLIEAPTDQFDWYQAVGWQWRIESCVDAEAGTAECTASATNTWSEAMDLDPVVGRFLVQVSDQKVTTISETGDPFSDQWLSFVFPSFFNWVTANHPDDAATMFETDSGLTEEILELYELNTIRFVDDRNIEPTG